MTKSLIVMLVSITILGFVSAAHTQEAATGSKDCKYSGTVTERTTPDLLTIEAGGKIMEFVYKHPDKGCIAWTALNAGENVSIVCKKDKDHKPLEATCVIRVTPTFTGSMTGGSIK